MILRVAALLATLACAGRDCWAWGAFGHEWVSGIAIEKLPDSVPAFVRASEAAAKIAVMGRELDRSEGSGKTPMPSVIPGTALGRLNAIRLVVRYGSDATF